MPLFTFSERFEDRVRRFVERLTSSFSPQSSLFVIATLVGVVTGLCAGLFKLAISSMASLFTVHFSRYGINWMLLLLPVAGFMLVYIFRRRFVGLPLRHGTDIVTASVAKGDYLIPSRLTFSWMVAGTLTLGFGGSAGSEGPIASTGAAIGSNIGRICRQKSDMIRILIGCGAGAGIAAIFKAPLGGFLFTLEVMKLSFTTLPVMALLLACLVASLVAYAMSGFTVDVSFVQAEQFDPGVIPWIIALGAVCGFYSLYYSAVMKLMGRVYGSLRRQWLVPLVCGAELGLLLLLFPALYGEGYGVMQKILNGSIDALFADGPFAMARIDGITIALFCFALVIVKAFASSATTDGGVAGDFAPTLYAGCILGLLFATVANLGFDASLPAGAFAFLGMAGVMAGVIRAPFMAIFLTAEMCNSFMLLLPLAVVAAVATGVVRIFKPQKAYPG